MCYDLLTLIVQDTLPFSNVWHPFPLIREPKLCHKYSKTMFFPFFEHATISSATGEYKFSFSKAVVILPEALVFASVPGLSAIALFLLSDRISIHIMAILNYIWPMYVKLSLLSFSYLISSAALSIPSSKYSSSGSPKISFSMVSKLSGSSSGILNVLKCLSSSFLSCFTLSFYIETKDLWGVFYMSEG